MRVLVIGLGSMGRRRIRLLKKIVPDIQILGIDADERRAESARKDFSIEIGTNLEKALSDSGVSCAVVSTSPLAHSDIIARCLKERLHVFSELNLVSDGYEENIRLAEQNDRILFLSSTFLYREEIGFIEREVRKASSRLNYMYHVGQYLPDWHPWEKYHNFFVSDHKTNGCRELFAIELPWMVKTFGKIINFNIMKSKNSALDVDYMDNYLLLLEHESGAKGTLAVDVISRKAVRNLEIWGEDMYISWDGSPAGLRKYDIQNKKEVKIDLYDKVDSLEGYSSFVVENAYRNELIRFFDVIDGKERAEYTFSDDLETLKLIDQIEGICK